VVDRESNRIRKNDRGNCLWALLEVIGDTRKSHCNLPCEEGEDALRLAPVFLPQRKGSNCMSLVLPRLNSQRHFLTFKMFPTQVLALSVYGYFAVELGTLTDVIRDAQVRMITLVMSEVTRLPLAS
jgi:hypothetical protein